jgi:hypothetical protein
MRMLVNFEAVFNYVKHNDGLHNSSRVDFIFFTCDICLKELVYHQGGHRIFWWNNFLSSIGFFARSKFVL